MGHQRFIPKVVRAEVSAGPQAAFADGTDSSINGMRPGSILPVRECFLNQLRGPDIALEHVLAGPGGAAAQNVST